MKVLIHDERLGALAEQKELVGKQEFPQEVITKLKQRIFQISQAKNLQDLRAIKSLHLEKLKQTRYKGKYSIRLNKAYRLIVSVAKDEMSIEVVVIEEVNNHYT
ncbi:plasmid maintenance system killer protein [Pedobacter sp. KBW06]|uniref:type II toxin-antitoxin system RelE/ParE family toxin n=1 Tax=Pedobacter sp. KBW06 TaxID=2153359 RepID=UPI000F5B68C7|nr:type II toxin-antitoxin system RelE/ParE family toxin [Pedobacter sp. KBW06]RQO75578.1 plasmid maintenance system killer protein [Pedobacter sp. KBW06]